ncbi:MAG TPA: hypothetical protein VFD58_27600 [Blastocatellia bacterium]|nr:hypothetical protein [Blastocatellia bacterium]
MYKCEICGQNSQPRTPAYKVTIETRAVLYPERPKANSCWKLRGDRRKFVHPDDPGGTGEECAREVTVCARCAANLAGSAGFARLGRLNGHTKRKPRG